MKVVGNPNASVSFKAESKANFTIEKDAEETVGTDGVLKQYVFNTVYSFMKVNIDVQKLTNYMLKIFYF